MKERLKLEQVEPEAYKAMLGLEKYLHRSGLSRTLLDLIKIRASQINRCAFCIDMHTKDARKNGKTEQRIYALNAWNETPFFTNEERAALAMTEAVTLVAGNSISDDLYEEVSRYFTANSFAQILIAILTLPGVNARGFFSHGHLPRLISLPAPGSTSPEAILNSTGCPTAEIPRFLITWAAATSLLVV